MQRSQSVEDGYNYDKAGEELESDSWAQIALKFNYEHDLVFAAKAIDITDAYYDVSISLQRHRRPLIRQSWH